MSATSITLIVTIVGSPILVPIFDYIRNRIWAKFTFHGYQAIFMGDPGSSVTYFGIITSISKTDVTLTDVYWLDYPGLTPENIDEVRDPQLIKLGQGQIHHPEDKMIINRQYIAFLENLTNESNVVQAILEYKKSLKPKT